MRRLFAVLGMVPVGYYDLSAAGVPVHSTAFRATAAASLRRSPFRLFTSLLRLDLIADPALRAQAASILQSRRIVAPRALALIERFEAQGRLDDDEAVEFIEQALQSFRWHGRCHRRCRHLRVAARRAPACWPTSSVSRARISTT